MSAPWWVKGATPDPLPAWTQGTGAVPQPVLLQSAPATVAAEVTARTAAYTPEWTARTSDDTGMALVTLFGGMMEPVLTRVNQLPLKAFVEALRILGVEPLAAEPVSVVLQFSVLGSATDPVLVPKGFQVGARPASGTGSLIVLETQTDLYATAAQVAQLQVQEGGYFLDVTASLGTSLPFAPFGATASVGTALYIGLKAPAPQIQIALVLDLGTSTGAPAPVAAGGVVPLPAAPTPTLVWEVYDGGSGTFTPMTVVNDGTRGLVQSGIIVLGIPATWGSGTPPGMNASAALNWMRVRVAFGQFLPAPNISDVSLNVVPALAVQTVSNESVNFGSDKTLRNATLSQTPVLPESLTVTVFNDPLSPTEETEWTEVPDIQQARPDQKVYEFDPATGEITFGDGVHGAAVPQGFRNVFATYQVISPSTGVLGAGAANTLISSAPNVTGVTNPDPGSGGTQVGTQAEAIGRGPQLFRAQGRAVTTADFAFLATQTAGIVRATAIAGRHPAYPGNPIPGVVGVYVVPPDTNPTFGQGPAPIPNAATLGAVAGFLSGNAALAGVDVVAAAPVFRYVRAQVSVAASAAVATSVYQNVLAALVTYLHPETGGADGTGWPFGAPLLYTPLVLFLTSVPGVTGISSLTLEIDGQRLPPCSDFAIGADSLFWSLQHQIVPDMGEGGS